jgi:uncharacterized protein DUF4412
MKTAGFVFFANICLLLCARGDLTIVQKVEGVAPSSEMTIKIKGDKARIDATPQFTTIVDGKTGEMINLMKDQKTIVRISAEKMKAAAEMLNKYDGKNVPAGKPKLTPTGKKETINGYEAEEYTCDTPAFKATYWLAPKFPNGAAILKQLQSLKSEMWNRTNANMPDYRDFSALPIKTIISMGSNQITSTIVSVTQDPLNDAEFAVPKDFQEMNVPEMGKMFQQDEKKPSAADSPKP